MLAIPHRKTQIVILQEENRKLEKNVEKNDWKTDFCTKAAQGIDSGWKLIFRCETLFRSFRSKLNAKLFYNTFLLQRKTK